MMHIKEAEGESLNPVMIMCICNAFTADFWKGFKLGLNLTDDKSTVILVS